MKKAILAMLVAAVLAVPFGNTALAGWQDAPVLAAVREYIPGDVPAETTVAESMLPAIHGLVMAMLDHDTDRFDPVDNHLAWEGLYNMLSLYGQLDGRCDGMTGAMYLSGEMVRDHAAALGIDLDVLVTVPEDLTDRMSPDGEGYVVMCGDEGLAEIRTDGPRTLGDGSLELAGELFDLGEDDAIIGFRAVLEPRDTVFGFVVTGLDLY